MIYHHVVLVGHSIDRDGTKGVRIEPHPSTLERIADYGNIDVLAQDASLTVRELATCHRSMRSG